MDNLAAIDEGMQQELLRERRLYELLDQISGEEALELGREAAHAVLGPLLLRSLLGEDRFDTTSAARLLRVTRQALHKAVHAGRLLGVPGRGTTWFPAWQFDVDRGQVRPSARAVLAVWTDVLGTGWDPETVMAWSNSPQPELAGQTPAEWVEQGGNDEPVRLAARRAAHRLAS